MDARNIKVQGKLLGHLVCIWKALGENGKYRWASRKTYSDSEEEQIGGMAYMVLQPSLFSSGRMGGELLPWPIVLIPDLRPLGDHHLAERPMTRAS